MAMAMPMMSIPSAPVAPAASASTAMADGAVLATLDVDTLDCSVCMESLTPPIFQCSNGHIACQSCRSKISDVCPTCSKPLGSIRCLAIEKLIETLSVSCKFADHGCGAMPKFVHKAIHERSCEFRPCACPIKPCNVSAPTRDLLAHIVEAHQVARYDFSWEARCTLFLAGPEAAFFLLKVEGLCFLLHQDKHSLGSSLYVTYFGAAAPDEYLYQVELKNGKKRLLFESVAQTFSQSRQPMDFLVVPAHMFPSKGPLQLEVSLQRVGSSSAKKRISFQDAMF
ncbi:E3 ubiquitin-protein ligase SINA-like 10 [Selaginella moellendorffii]|uniref:E3 ubiquitin-protein ligase SINA-like 10 n=1 Tax=Selaginella moellendorffii TaxID=88036 RepID=UPI000D1CE721|nr:E3 ubiquitin-protein ligase SINA-like 10 [Selaginella moellendorffii]|eukprot:XP_002965124.2 E3 ubiquitin-protein ligase SINA-like 10 [Selaginella moellendorffii]